MTTLNIGARLRALRSEQGISLSELSRRSAVGKGTISEIESGQRNPTVETLYALCAPLGVPLTALLGEEPGVDSTSVGGIRTTLLSARRAGQRIVEVFRIEFAAGAEHVSPGHGAGVTEHLTMATGELSVGPLGSETLVRPGETHSWSSETAHRYAAGGAAGEGVLVILTPRS